MPNKTEKERRKQITEELRKKSDEDFQNNLPISRELFKKLFDYSDSELSLRECDDSLKLTEIFLNQNGVMDISFIKTWLANNNGYCDCEVLANVEEKFE